MTSPTSLIALPTEELLARFGDEKPTPGSGCAAALMGLLAASLIAAVARLTKDKAAAERDRERAQLILDLAEGRLSLSLKDAFQRDAELFDEVIEIRKARDLEVNSNRKATLSRKANAALQPATDILFGIIDRCFEIIENGIALYRIGYSAARGDTGAALSATVAAISSAIFVIILNAKASKARWAVDALQRVDQVQTRLAAQQVEIFRSVRQSKDEALVAIQNSFEGITGSNLSAPKS